MKRKKSISFWTKILVLLLIGFAMVFPSSCTDPSLAPQGYGHSLRLITYNTELIVGREDKYDMTSAARAEQIATRILKEEYDIIVLEEVFLDEARDKFVEKLKETYPSYIKILRDDNTVTQDSGLMLFSRYPFTSVPNNTYVDHMGSYAEGCNGVDQQGDCKDLPDVAFYEYAWAECLMPDCAADKGVGIVRVELPTGEYANIVFTHTQADYGNWSDEENREAVEKREWQLKAIYSVITGTLNPEQIENEQIYLMGDLNIDGNLFDLEPEWGMDEAEWTSRFNSPAGSTAFFSNNLKDSWAFQTLTTDPGQTHGGGFPFFPLGPAQGKRLDYILYNPDATTTVVGISETPYCVQHVSKAWELADDYGEEFLSDHIPVKADINLCADYCNPLEACLVNISIENPSEILLGELTYPGSMQWYCINEPGTYSFNTVAVDCEVEFDVYESDDLSRPINSLDPVKTEYGWQFDMPEAPFYIRVFAPDRSSHGQYWIKFYKHCGNLPELAIHLLPATDLTTYQWPTTWALNDENAVWFWFSTDVSTRDEYPELEFLAAVPGISPDISKPQLLDENKKVISEPNDTVWTLVGDYQYYGWLMKQDDLPEGKYYLKVLPETPDPKGQQFFIGWETTLTYFRPVTLKCSIQGDITGDDDIWMLVKTDQDENSYQSYRVYDLGAFDEESPPWGVSKSTNGFVWKFVRNVCVELVEQDGELDENLSGWLFPSLHDEVPVRDWDNGNTEDWYGGYCFNTLPTDQEGLVQDPVIIRAWFKDVGGDWYWEYPMLVERAHDLSVMNKQKPN